MNKSEKTARKIEAAYEKMRTAYPDAADKEIEWATRKYLFNRKLRVAAALFFGGGIAMLILASLRRSVLVSAGGVSDTIIPILIAAAAICELSGALYFAKALRDPLTPNEGTERAKRSAMEKGGKQEEDNK